jgi:dTDP-4-amino-4,6-dideoxygalactose transaminase
MSIPFLNFSPVHTAIRTEMQQAFERVYDRGWFVLGEEVEAFERAYAAFNQTGFCVGLSNGLDALHLALRALDIGPGDEVIVPSNTYIATVLAVSYVGATPIFVEPDPHTYNLDPARLEAAVTANTRAVMPVHLYGQACEMEAIMALAQKHGLFVVEDNAQAQGAAYRGILTGAWGDANGTSFYPGKNLGALGDAGALTTAREDIARKVRVLRNYGSQKKYFNEVIGYNMRLDELQAALLQVKLKYLDSWTLQRQQIAAWYDETLQGIGDLVLPVTAPGATHVYHLYVVRTQRRDALQAHLTEKGIGTLIHYPIPPHLQEAYAPLGHKKGDFPIAERIAETCLSLPLWPGMTEQDVWQVGQAISKFFHGG